MWVVFDVWVEGSEGRRGARLFGFNWQTRNGMMSGIGFGNQIPTDELLKSQ